MNDLGYYYYSIENNYELTKKYYMMAIENNISKFLSSNSCTNNHIIECIIHDRHHGRNIARVAFNDSNHQVIANGFASGALP